MKLEAIRLDVGDWCWHTRHAAPCRVVERQDMWGESVFRVWLPTRNDTRLKEERERAVYAYNSRYQAIGRIGLPAVRDHRRKRLDAEHQARMAAIDDAEAIVPDLNAVMMLRVGELLSSNKDDFGVRLV